MPRFAELARLWSQAERALLAPACLLCEEQVSAREGDALICGLCRSRWHRIEPPWCPRCGATVELDDPCTLCSDWPDGLSEVRSAVWLDDPARQTVHALKYRGWWRVTEAMALAMRSLEPLARQPVLVPVPLGSRRRRRRGYNQSAMLARALADISGGRLDESVLRRGRETRSQTALTPDQRQANVAGAFMGEECTGRHLVLVDDVFTTGATLAAAGTALRAAGAARVDAVTFARARTALD